MNRAVYPMVLRGPQTRFFFLFSKFAFICHDLCSVFGLPIRAMRNKMEPAFSM
jgi:hypothetical protein